MKTLFNPVWKLGGPALAGLLVLGASSAPADAALCMARESLTQALADRFGEAPSVMGLDAGGHMIVIFAARSGTWTATSMSAQGEACVIDSGDGWTQNTQSQEAALPTQ